jgi:hypothetical protein
VCIASIIRVTNKPHAKDQVEISESVAQGGILAGPKGKRGDDQLRLHRIVSQKVVIFILVAARMKSYTSETVCLAF